MDALRQINLGNLFLIQNPIQIPVPEPDPDPGSWCDRPAAEREGFEPSVGF
jgi:hypothetical protein